MKQEDAFFVGWSADTPKVDRRFMLAGALTLIAGGAAIGAGLGSNTASTGEGLWAMGGTRSLRGLLTARPYPSLFTQDLDGTVRTVFLATTGKTAPPIDRGMMETWVAVTGTLITRGQNTMMAVSSIAPSSTRISPVQFNAPIPVDRGPVLLVGEILDAKCWFGAMRPGYGKTHKSCAALCARGGLPLAFCQLGACGDGVAAPLFLDSDGQAFGHSILPLVADPVSVQGRLVEIGDVMQVHARLSDIRRL